VHDKNSHPSSHYLQQHYNGLVVVERLGSSTEMHYYSLLGFGGAEATTKAF